MSSITTKSTKAEILGAYQELKAKPTTWADTAALTADTLASVSRETVALARDCYNLGALSRQWVSRIVDELSQPVIRSKA